MSNRWQDIIFPKKMGMKRIATSTNSQKRIYADVLFNYPSIEMHVSHIIQ